MKSPFWGYGLGTGDYVLHSHLRKDLGVSVSMINVHSVVLRSRIETGYLGLGLLAAFLTALFIELVRNIRGGNRYAVLGILSFLYYALCLLIEPMLSWYRFSASIFFVIFAVALKRNLRSSQEEKNHSVSSRIDPL